MVAWYVEHIDVDGTICCAAACIDELLELKVKQQNFATQQVLISLLADGYEASHQHEAAITTLRQHIKRFQKVPNSLRRYWEFCVKTW
jgi:hypothetical protein